MANRTTLRSGAMLLVRPAALSPLPRNTPASRNRTAESRLEAKHEAARRKRSKATALTAASFAAKLRAARSSVRLNQQMCKTKAAADAVRI